MRIILLIALALISNSSYSQWLTQSAEGKGSFLFKGTSVALDLGKTDFSFTINNLNRPLRVSNSTDNNFFFYGGGLNAKSEEGIGNLFSTGDLVPSANINGYTGIRFSNSFNEIKRKIDAQASSDLQQISQQQISSFRNIMGIQIDIVINRSSLDPTIAQEKGIIDMIRRDFKNSLNIRKNGQQFVNFLGTYQAATPAVSGNVEMTNIITSLITISNNILSQLDSELNNTRDQLVTNYDSFIRSNLWQLSLFVIGGIDAQSFKRVEEINVTSLSKSFIKEEFRGGNIGIGMNYQKKRMSYGITYKYRETNNFTLLDKTEYKLISTVGTPNTQVLTQEKTIAAYSGTNPKYGVVKINEVNADVLYNLSLGKDADASALLNLYLRANVFTRDATVLPNTYSLGLGTYFFSKKSKFLGGLYIEFPDLDNAYEKLKPEADQNLRTAVKRFTFGIITKFSLNSLISAQ